MKKQPAKNPLPQGANRRPPQTAPQSVLESVTLRRWKILPGRLMQLVTGKAPPESLELARLAAVLLPEEEKRAIASGDLWRRYEEDGCFEENRALDNAFAAATYLFSRSVAELLGQKAKLEEYQANRIPLPDAAKRITSEKRPGRAQAKLEAFVLRVCGEDEGKKRLEEWRREGVSQADLIAFKAEYKINNRPRAA